jgi:hypothetical protein
MCLQEKKSGTHGCGWRDNLYLCRDTLEDSGVVVDAYIMTHRWNCRILCGSIIDSAENHQVGVTHSWWYVMMARINIHAMKVLYSTLCNGMLNWKSYDLPVASKLVLVYW